ncbi:LOW QUALITY PROTEIN: uncharacterized protein ACNS7B_024511 [Menidia menidia]
MESGLLIGWQQQKAELEWEVCRLQEELAESRAEKEELRSRSRALSDRLCQTGSPPRGLRGEEEEEERRRWRSKLREGREREARQALLIHRLQNKVVEYRDRCQHLDLQLQDEQMKMLQTEQRLRGDLSCSLEGALIRLEEEQHRSVSLSDTNTLLRDQLSQSEQANQALRDDLHKLTADWTRAMEEAEQREASWLREKECSAGRAGQHQDRLMSVWSSVVSLRKDCHSVKTAADRDLWQLRADFSRLSSSLLSSWDSVCSSRRLSAPHSRTCASSDPPPPFSPALSSTLLLPPPGSASTLRAFSPGEQEEQGEELQEQLEEEVQEEQKEQLKLLQQRVEELSRSLQVGEEQQEEQQEEREREKELREESERRLQSVGQAVVRLSRVLGLGPQMASRMAFVPRGPAPDGSWLLAVLSQAEAVLQRRRQEQTEAELNLRRLGQENGSLQLRLKRLEDDNQQLNAHKQHTQQELTHTTATLSSEKELSSSLRLQLEEVQKREEEEKRENQRLRRERDRQEERSLQLEAETHRRVEMELLENVQLTEREALQRMEIHFLKGALEREQMDRQRAEEEAVDARDALQKSRESALHLSTCESLLRREVEEGRDALEKMAALNSALGSDKRELSQQLLQVECELSGSQSQLQALRSEVGSLHRDLRALNTDCGLLQAQEEQEAGALLQLREQQEELEARLEEKERRLASVEEENRLAARSLEELSSQHASLCEELREAREEARQQEEEREGRSRQQEELQRENRRLQEELGSLQRLREQLQEELQELRPRPAALQLQLSLQQQRVSRLEVQRSQLSSSSRALQQAKLALQEAALVSPK